ncbi:hypothetical protein DL1_01870 [Thioclava dalianensis]|uniref:DUF3572 domain-containing protein n=1 Tax=Thioclava dalianensis TaxID=1185766 RepID=A0A074TI27_9RHOB|nr:DUF3572 domain-containing protein [Thioclava dalianensis]KEP69800.1 hypothetical protein DL1_01870 [Thioclava dalianensis]SFM86048.1 Protein of unknown function [Thioclava dalianensis]
MQHDSAHILAIRSLGWLVSNETLIDGFLAHTGASQEDLRAQAGDPDFLCGVLDYLMLNDQWVLDCAADLAVAPEDLAGARTVLGRGDQRHWT